MSLSHTVKLAAMALAIQIRHASAAALVQAPSPAVVVERNAVPVITPAPIYERIEVAEQKRDIISDIASVAGDVGDDIKSLGSNVANLVTSQLTQELNFLDNFPSPDDIQSSLGIDDDQVDALPTQVLNIPNYANWTDEGWNLRFRANVYKQPNISQSKLDDLANVFLIDTSVEELDDQGKAQARNVTQAIFVLQQDDVNATFHLTPAPSQGASGEPGGGGATTAPGGEQTINYPYETTAQGDIDGFVIIDSDGLENGNDTSEVQRLNVYTEGSQIGNATSFLVPPRGFTVISDIDDILRVTKIWNPKEGLLNTFARPFTQWMNMPDIYANWSRSIPDIHFHYLTTTPEQVTRNYMDFIYKTYPGGSFDTRPLNFSDVSATLSIRQYLLERIFQTFPERKFILVADTSNSDVMKDYPELATNHPEQVQCILLRNTSATDDSMYFPYNTEGFENLNTDSYFFFNTPDDLTNLDIQGGKCRNASVQQHVTFDYQNLPFDDDDEDDSAAVRLSMGSSGLVGLVLAAAWFVL